MPYAHSNLKALRRPRGGPSAEPARLRALAHVRRFHREQEIYSQDELNDTWYRVILGSARKYLLRADGRRQIVDIYLPGDLFGFSARLHHRFAAQAVAEGTLIACYPRRRVEVLAEEDSGTGLEIRLQLIYALERLQEQMLVVGTMTAQEKVWKFLVYYQQRLSTGHDEEIALPISRYDIADLLGISSETVCRAFTDLQARGVISLKGPRRIRLMHRERDKDTRLGLDFHQNSG